jgi:RNA polymerase sigma factor (sigma-70 family)
MEPTLADLETIYRMEYHRFLRVAEAISGDPHLGADAVNEGFAGAIRARGQFRGNGTLEAWLWSCVVNAARNARRRQQPSADVGALAEPEAVEQPAADATLRELVGGLPERQRLALFLRYYADLDYREIARVLGTEVGTVGATLNKAHGALRKRLVEVAP